MKKIKIKTNLVFGIVAVLTSAFLFYVIPKQIKIPTFLNEVVNGQVIPYAMASLIAILGIVSLFNAVVLKKWGEKELVVGKEVKNLLYLLAIAIFIVGAKYVSFLLFSLLFVNFSLWYMNAKSWKKFLIVNVLVIIFVVTFRYGLNLRFGGLWGI